MKYTEKAMFSPMDNPISLASGKVNTNLTVRQRRILWLFYVGPLLVWMAVIFLASTGAGSGENSSRLIRGLLELVSPAQARAMSPHTLDVLNLVVRKMGHLTEYAILTLLAVRAIQFGEKRLKSSAFFGAFGLSAVYACSDEIHQYFVPGRGASPIDVAIDLSGVILVMVGIVLGFWLKSWERRLRGNEETTAS